MTDEARTEVVLHGLRWANNLLTEVVGNHGAVLNGAVRALMLEVLTKLNEAQDEIRRELRTAERRSEAP